ncbi:carbonic anhydrase 5B, mitochondrial-like isoform X1 [Rhincodon typus]|uniref:carbonic anhydrase 5B, mitochondrial-like isoform X1 n=1 Tax=Rhincodon typus TaxID=259920 RepID=UPI0009A32132|nr:carbonic anhydrase 5B, mitochondrial-like isoform X1 [Rhincodon typus]XP_048461667.1 carbonic anhydrase 5B, mitochondrial-like isoform X1 [Rhincodon typus]XP_048461668.1 carbonic anhydrase 5B, mitochondrial-like isoform X1 [Rhincodon typus]
MVFSFRVIFAFTKRFPVRYHWIPVRNCNFVSCTQNINTAKWQNPVTVSSGTRQSPIDINTADCVYDPQLKPLKISYDPNNCLRLRNNGYYFQVEFEDSRDSSVISGGPLKNQYRLKQFHFHWGSKSEQGSEHTVNNQVYPAELHLVHWNPVKCNNSDVAILSEDGLAVVGIFLKLGKKHYQLQKLIDALPAVKHKGSAIDFLNFDPACMIPSCSDYWTYPGSLTSPPLTECVTWVIMKDPIEISPEQLAAFRSLFYTSIGEKQKNMVDNYRPVQPLLKRTVYSTISPFQNSVSQ